MWEGPEIIQRGENSLIFGLHEHRVHYPKWGQLIQSNVSKDTEDISDPYIKARQEQPVDETQI